MAYELATLALWTIAIAATLVTAGAGAWTVLGPVYAVCMIGSVVTVRSARSRGGRKGR